MLTQTQNSACEHKFATGISRLVAIGVLTGFTSALFAAGGAPIVIFGLLWFCGYSMKETIGPSLATLAAGALVGFSLRFYLQSGDLYLRMAMTMLPFGVAGVIAGHRLARRWSSKFLQGCFSCIVVFVGLKMLGISVFPTLSVPQGDVYWLLCGTAALAGFGSRMLGTGGGLLTVPVLMYAGLVPHQALITSLCLNIPIMVFGATLNLSGESPRWREVSFIIFGAIVGASIGAYISYTYVPDAALRMLFGGLLVASAAITMSSCAFRAFQIHTVPSMRLQRQESSPI